MKIILAGGGTGGHFYPLIAVARALRDIAERERIINLDLTFASPDPYDQELLRKEEIRYLKVPAGKLRRYFSILNIFDPIKSFFGIIKASWNIYLNFPDVIFAKGGYASFPVLFAAKFFGIPLVIHESDIIPGKVSKWSSRFASRIAVSFPETAKNFPTDKVALTGNPIRKQILGGNELEAKGIFDLEGGLSTILVLGGSQGAKPINDVLLDILPELVKTSQVIHQAGDKNIEEVKLRAGLVLEKSDFKKRYHVFPFLDEGALRNAYYASSLVISRAGAGNIFEIAASSKPSILIPLSHAAQDHQRENAYAYARGGSSTIVEEQNLTPHILLAEMAKILNDKSRQEKMSKAAQSFAKVDAAYKIAEEILRLALKHS